MPGTRACGDWRCLVLDPFYNTASHTMNTRIFKTSTVVLLSLILGNSPLCQTASACSRATWLGRDGSVITGRSMDWPYDFNSHMYVIPRGTSNEGMKGGLVWDSKYGTVIMAGAGTPGGPIDAAFDGLNEKGLGANLLYLAECDFGAVPADAKPRISFGAWVQHVLSNYATVDEVVGAAEKDGLCIVPVNFGPGGAAHATVHLSVTDASGDSAVIEYIKGKPVIHHGRKYQVMTNSPVFEQQLALNAYWCEGRLLHQEARGGRDGCAPAGCRGDERDAECVGSLGSSRSSASQHRTDLLENGP